MLKDIKNLYNQTVRLLFLGEKQTFKKCQCLTRFLLVRKNYNGNKVKPLKIILPKISAYVKSYDGLTKWMQFLIEDDDYLEKYNTIWDKFSADIKK